MFLFIECSRGYHNSSLHAHTPSMHYLHSHFLPFCFLPHLLFCPPLFSPFFFPSVFVPVFISHALVAVLFVFPISSHTPRCLCLSSFLFRSLSFISAPLLPLDLFMSSLPLSILSSLSFHPSIPPSSKAMDQGRDGLIAVWCAFARLRATQFSSVRLVINGLCFYWYIANTFKKSNTSH